MNHSQTLLEVLKEELAFLDEGGYRTRSRYPWRPNFVFQDSPTCLNYKNFGEQRPCKECHLIDLVPEQQREARFPCRHIQLTPHGETVNSFYQWGTEEELEKALRAWLERTIREMETGEKAEAQGA